MSEAHFAMVSEWMDSGNINEFVKANPDEDRLKLVRISLKITHPPRLNSIDDRITSWETPLGD